MPCGTRARLTAYVAYQTLTFAERDVLLSALADAGYTRVELATSRKRGCQLRSGARRRRASHSAALRSLSVAPISPLASAIWVLS